MTQRRRDDLVLLALTERPSTILRLQRLTALPIDQVVESLLRLRASGSARIARGDVIAALSGHWLVVRWEAVT